MFDPRTKKVINLIREKKEIDFLTINLHIPVHIPVHSSTLTRILVILINRKLIKAIYHVDRSKTYVLCDRGKQYFSKKKVLLSHLDINNSDLVKVPGYTKVGRVINKVKTNNEVKIKLCIDGNIIYVEPEKLSFYKKIKCGMSHKITLT